MDGNYIHLFQLDSVDRSLLPTDSQTLKPIALFVPSHFVSSFVVESSKIPAKYLDEAIPGMAEEFLATSLETVAIAYRKLTSGKSIVLACERSKIAEWKELGRISGFEFSAIYPDFYLTPVNTIALSLCEGDDYAVVRTGIHEGYSGHEAVMREVIGFSEAAVESVALSISIERGKEGGASVSRQELDEAISLLPISSDSFSKDIKPLLTKTLKYFIPLYGLLIAVLLGWQFHYQRSADRFEDVLLRSYSAMIGAEIDSLSGAESLQRLLQSAQNKGSGAELGSYLGLLNRAWGSHSVAHLSELKYEPGLITMVVSGDVQPFLAKLKTEPSFLRVSAERREEVSLVKIALPKEAK